MEVGCQDLLSVHFPIQVSHGCHSLHICLISEKKKKIESEESVNFFPFKKNWNIKFS